MRNVDDGEKQEKNTSLAAPGALAHRLQRRTACNTSPPNLSKMADRAWKYVKPYVIEPPDQLLLNKFFAPSIPYFDQSEALKYQMAARGPQNGRRGLERGPTLGYWALPSTFAKQSF